jgi:hypothetical protein
MRCYHGMTSERMPALWLCGSSHCPVLPDQVRHCSHSAAALAARSSNVCLGLTHLLTCRAGIRDLVHMLAVGHAQSVADFEHLLTL